jgi:hypothetical protein
MALGIKRSPIERKARAWAIKDITCHSQYPIIKVILTPCQWEKSTSNSSATHQANVEKSDAPIVDFLPLDTSCLIYSPGITAAYGSSVAKLYESYTTHDYASLTRTEHTLSSSRVAACDTHPNRAWLWLLGRTYRAAACGAAGLEVARRVASLSRRCSRARTTASGRRVCVRLRVAAGA